MRSSLPEWLWLQRARAQRLHNSTQLHNRVSSHLFEFESKEAVFLRADRHASDVWQRNAGLHLARFLVSQDKVLLGQQEDPWRSLQTCKLTFYPLSFPLYMFSFNAFLNACELQALSYNIAELSRNVWCLLEEKRCQLLCQKTSAHRVKCWNIHQNNKRRLCFTVENCRKSLNTQGRCVITLPVLGFPVCIQTKWTVNTVVCAFSDLAIRPVNLVDHVGQQDLLVHSTVEFLIFGVLADLQVISFERLTHTDTIQENKTPLYLDHVTRRCFYLAIR